MARIPEDELERIKRENDLAAMVRASGVELRQQGKDLVGPCPFHSGDDTPSMTVTPEKRLWHCFGCGAGGDVIEWVRKTRGLSFLHAVEILRAGGPPPSFGASPVKTRPSGCWRRRSSLTPPTTSCCSRSSTTTTPRLRTSPEALAYLKKRCIDTPEARDPLQARLRQPHPRPAPAHQAARQDGLVIRERLERLGIYRASGREHLNGSLAIPILDADGQVTEMYGRKIVHHLRPAPPSHLYLPGPHRGVWQPRRLPRGPRGHPVRGADRRPDVLLPRLPAT